MAPFRSRFGFVWGARPVRGGAFALLLTGSHDSGPRLAANWSSWEPDSSKMVEGAREIADAAVHPQRTRPNGRPPGKPTRERGRLLMREALELALYSYRYLEARRGRAT